MEKYRISKKSFQTTFFKKMDSENDNQEVFYCDDDDGEYRVYCNICHKLLIERFLKNHLKSQTHPNIIRKR